MLGVALETARSLADHHVLVESPLLDAILATGVRCRVSRATFSPVFKEIAAAQTWICGQGALTEEVTSWVLNSWEKTFGISLSC